MVSFENRANIDDVFEYRHKPSSSGVCTRNTHTNTRRINVMHIHMNVTKSRDPTVYCTGCQQYMCLFVFEARSMLDCSRPVLPIESYLWVRLFNSTEQRERIKWLGECYVLGALLASI